MKTDLCGDDVVIHLTPQLLAAEGVNLSGSGGAASRAASAAVECGRRLLVAARAGDTDTVRELMAKGAPFTCDWLGTSPLHLAAANAKLETVQLLLRAGVSRDARTKVERTPLHLAAYAGHADCVNALIEGGAAVDAVDLLRMSALHWAVRRGHAAAARALLRAGADPTRHDKFLQTPLALAQRAAQAGSPDMLRLIEETLREREAAESVDALVSERTAEEAAMSTQSQPSTVRIQRISDTKMSTPKTSTPEKTQTKTTIKIDSSIPVTCAGAGAGAGLAGVGAGVAEALLRKHGITLLPADDGSTVLSALQSGRTVVLSDAGKLMLKESSSTTPIPEPLVSRAEAGVVLTATPVAAPPPGVKVFNLNSSAKVLAKEQKVPPVSLNRRIDKDKGDVQQVKLQLNASSSSNTTSPGGKSSPGGTNNSARPAVRIIMNKQNFRKLISTATKATFPDESQSALMEELADSDSEGSSESVVVVPEQFVRSSSPQYLRSQLLCAHAALHHVAGRLRRARAKLAACTRHRTH